MQIQLDLGKITLLCYLERALLHNVVFPMVIGQWSRYGEPLDGNLTGHNTNVFREDDAIKKMAELFSFKGQWILEISRIANGSVY